MHQSERRVKSRIVKDQRPLCCMASHKDMSESNLYCWILREKTFRREKRFPYISYITHLKFWKSMSITYWAQWSSALSHKEERYFDIIYYNQESSHDLDNVSIWFVTRCCSEGRRYVCTICVACWCLRLFNSSLGLC